MTKDQKFERLKERIKNIKKVAAENSAVIFYDGFPINPEQIVINDSEILVKFNEFTSDRLYEHNPDFDHGWYDSLKVLEKRIKDHFDIYKKLEY